MGGTVERQQDSSSKYDLLDQTISTHYFNFLKISLLCSNENAEDKRRMKNTLFTLSRCAVDIKSCISSAQCLQLFLALFHLPDLTVEMISVLDSIFIITNVFPQPWVITAQKLLVEDQLHTVDHVRQILFAILAFVNALEHINIWREQSYSNESQYVTVKIHSWGFNTSRNLCIFNNEVFYFAALRFLERSNRNLKSILVAS